MITVQEWTTIRCLKAQGVSNRAIAKQLGISRNTVKRALKEDDPPRYQRRTKPNLQLKPFEDQIQVMLRKGLIGTRILRELRTLGYKGSQAALYRYLAKVKVDDATKVTERYETAPGEQAQFDWSSYTVELGEALTPVTVFCLTLGYSRRKFYWASLDQTQGSIFEALEEAFLYFRGVTKKLLVDNPRAFVLDPRPGRFQWNPRFLELCGHYRVEPVACRVGRARTKGKVERPFYYLEEHFIKDQRWESFDHFCAELARFVREELDMLVHSTTQERPIDRFEEERRCLTPLPAGRFVSTREEFRKVSWDCLVSYGGSRYSVPYRYAGKHVWVRASQGTRLEVYDQQGHLIVTHQLSPRKGVTVLVQAHYEGLRRAPKTRVLLEQAFLARFPGYGWFLDGLYAQYKGNAVGQLRFIVELADLYPHEAFARALEIAGKYHTFSHRFLRGLLEHDQPALIEPGPTPIHGLPDVDVHRDLSTYQQLLQGGEVG